MHAGDEGVEVGAVEFPLEWPSDALKVALELVQPLGDVVKAAEVIGG